MMLINKRQGCDDLAKLMKRFHLLGPQSLIKFEMGDNHFRVSVILYCNAK